MSEVPLCNVIHTEGVDLEFSGLLLVEYGAYKTVKARFWPWLSGEGP